MCANITEDDVGKKVFNANGEQVGMVSGVQHGTAHVDPDPGLTDTIKATLGWQDVDEDTYPLQEAAVDRITDDEIHLQGDLEERTGERTSTGHSEGIGTEHGEGTDRDERTDVREGRGGAGATERREGAGAEAGRGRTGGTERESGAGGETGTEHGEDDELTDTDIDVGEDAEGHVETDLGDDDDRRSRTDRDTDTDSDTDT